MEKFTKLVITATPVNPLRVLEVPQEHVIKEMGHGLKEKSRVIQVQIGKNAIT